MAGPSGRYDARPHRASDSQHPASAGEGDPPQAWDQWNQPPAWEPARARGRHAPPPSDWERPPRPDHGRPPVREWVPTAPDPRARFAPAPQAFTRGAPPPGSWNEPPPGSWNQPPPPPGRQAPDPRRAPRREPFPPPSGQSHESGQTREGNRGKPTPNASVLFSKGQLALIVVVLGALAYGFYARPRDTGTAVVGACVAFYVATAVLKLVITTAGRRHRPPNQIRMRPGDKSLPPYAVLLIESDDLETLDAARRIGLPFVTGPRGNTPGDHIRVMVIPPGGPKTKPNALNVAMDVVVGEGCEFVTIYDAEDRPEVDQLLKAVGTFRGGRSDLACLQAELAFWNDNTNWVTALYWVGYKIHFTRFLPGLARLGLPIPLGGTSNHFRVSALLDIALQPGGKVWDANNLTEDADLGARLASGGYRVDLLQSVTMEEAPVKIGVVDKQQRRWKAGYLQTGLVHTRRPIRAMRRMGPVRWLCFNLLVLGVPIAFMLNPLSIALTAAYFVTRSTSIAQLFPTAVYYPAIAVMILGNFAVLYELTLTVLQESNHSKGRFDLLRYMLLSQFMWLWMSRSTYIATFELLTGKRTWHKTPHGHAEGPAEIEMAPAPRQLEAARQPRLPSRPDYPRRPGPDWGHDQQWGSEDATWRRLPGDRRPR